MTVIRGLLNKDPCQPRRGVVQGQLSADTATLTPQAPRTTTPMNSYYYHYFQCCCAANATDTAAAAASAAAVAATTTTLLPEIR